MSKADSYGYIREKLENAVRTLATHGGDARERVVAAFGALRKLKEEDFPPEHRKVWRSIVKEATKGGPLRTRNGGILRDSVEQTMKHVNKRTGAKITTKIWDLRRAIAPFEE